MYHQDPNEVTWATNVQFQRIEDCRQKTVPNQLARELTCHPMNCQRQTASLQHKSSISIAYDPPNVVKWTCAHRHKYQSSTARLEKGVRLFSLAKLPALRLPPRVSSFIHRPSFPYFVPQDAFPASSFKLTILFSTTLSSTLSLSMQKYPTLSP